MIVGYNITLDAIVFQRSSSNAATEVELTKQVRSEGAYCYIMYVFGQL